MQSMVNPCVPDVLVLSGGSKKEWQLQISRWEKVKIDGISIS
jgi:hypothetical protein